MKRILLVLLLVCACSAVAAAADGDVDAIVKAFEQQYGLRHKNLPWIARAFMKPALAGSGVSMNVKLFEHQSLPDTASLQAIEDIAGKALDESWRPFVRVCSRRDGERTLIYAKGEGQHLLMLIISSEPDETVVLKMKLKPSEAETWIAEPQARGRKEMP